MDMSVEDIIKLTGLFREQIEDTSTVNDLSVFSYKARKKGRREVSILYAYYIEAMESVYA